MRGRKFNRPKSQRKALLVGLARSLIKYEQIKTTLPKAKDLRPFVEKIITLCREDSVHARRQATAILRDKDIVKKLFSVVGPRYKERPGGYTRIIKAGHRYGDMAPVAVIEFVDRDVEARLQDKPVQTESSDNEGQFPTVA